MLKYLFLLVLYFPVVLMLMLMLVMSVITLSLLVQLLRVMKTKTKKVMQSLINPIMILKNWSWVAHMTMKQRECIGQILLNHKKIGYK